MQKLVMMLAMWLATTGVFAQYTLTGKVVDEITGDPIIGANVIIQSLNLGRATDQEGSFQFENIASGNYQIEISMVGYRTIKRSVEFKGNLTLNSKMTSQG
jgi:hypothetical protein